MMKCLKICFLVKSQFLYKVDNTNMAIMGNVDTVVELFKTSN